MGNALKWIWAERAWLFSGVGVAVVPLFLFAYRKIRAKSLLSVPVAVSLSVVASPTLTVLTPGALAPVEPTNGLPPLPSFDPAERKGRMFDKKEFPCDPPRPESVVKDVESVPPLQQAEKAQHYVGIPVRWSGQLTSLYRLEGDPSRAVRVSLAPAMRSYISTCQVRFVVPDAPGWSLIHEGTIVAVSGTISRVDGTTVHLSDVTILSFR